MSTLAAPVKRDRGSRNWCFTINNPTLIDQPMDWGCKYLVFQLEKGENETPHFQGYINFENAKTLGAVKNLNARAHWEPTRCVSASIDYCQKEEGRLDGPWTKGKVPREGQGQHRDLAEMKQYIDSGATATQIADQHFGCFLRYRPSILAYIELKTPDRELKPPNIIVYWGPTGVGKSRRADEEFPLAYRKMKTTSTGDWWDGYEGHESVIIDDFYGWIQHCELLRLLDRYPMRVKVHGGYAKFLAKNIIITSNVHPSEWYKSDKLKYEGGPLERRLMEFGKVIQMTGLLATVPTSSLPLTLPAVNPQDLAEFVLRQNPVVFPREMGQYRSTSPLTPSPPLDDPFPDIE